jgi:ferric-dicitrate binding protein FerR (iron transport regulator)
MTGQDPGNPADRAALAREDEINALLDGALDEAAVKALKAAAAEDSELAQAIVAAWQLQQSMDQLHLEKAPPSLRRKLRRIPHQHPAAPHRRLLPLPRWVLACGLASVVLIAVAMMMSPPPGPAVGPSQRAASGRGIDPAQVAQPGNGVPLPG